MLIRLGKVFFGRKAIFKNICFKVYTLTDISWIFEFCFFYRENQNFMKIRDFPICQKYITFQSLIAYESSRIQCRSFLIYGYLF